MQHHDEADRNTSNAVERSDVVLALATVMALELPQCN
jgi:hypothetical protein